MTILLQPYSVISLAKVILYRYKNKTYAMKTQFEFFNETTCKHTNICKHECRNHFHHYLSLFICMWIQTGIDEIFNVLNKFSGQQPIKQHT